MLRKLFKREDIKIRAMSEGAIAEINRAQRAMFMHKLQDQERRMKKMTTEEQTKIDLCGVWRNGLGQNGNPILLHVSKFDIGYNVWLRDFEAKAHIEASILKFPEGGMFPKRIEMVLPQNKCFVILVDTLFSVLSEKRMDVKLTGLLYGRSPLSSEPHETARVTTSIITHSQTDERLPLGMPISNSDSIPGTFSKIDGNTGQLPTLETSKTKWGTGETINIGDAKIEVISAPELDDKIKIVSQADLEKAWKGVMSDLESFSMLGGEDSGVLNAFQEIRQGRPL